MPRNTYFVQEPINTRVRVLNDFSSLSIRNYIVYIFTRFAMIQYAKYSPPFVRRLTEFMFLFLAVISLSLLIFVHKNFVQFPPSCVDHIKENWPKDGVLRVMIHHPYYQELNMNDANVYDSYTFTKWDNYGNQKKINSEPLGEIVWKDDYNKNYNLINNTTFDYYVSSMMNANIKCTIYFGDKKHINNTMNKSNPDTLKSKYTQIDTSTQCSKFPNNSINALSDTNNSSFVQFAKYNTDTKHKQNKTNINANSVIEYSLQLKLLHLSSKSRRQLGVPVMTVVLEPYEHKMILGSTVGVIALKYFVGYEHFLRSSLETIAFIENKEGFMRNAISGEKYDIYSIFPKMWYIYSYTLMTVLSILVIVSIKYLYNQMYYTIVAGLHIITVRNRLTISIVHFFSGISIFYVVEVILISLIDGEKKFFLIIMSLIADQYYVTCGRNLLTKKYWIRFFYMYQYLFYIYYFRFGGKYSNLALTCAFFFIQHSMFYFFHRYELPLVMADIQLFEIDNQLLQNRQESYENLRQRLIEHNNRFGGLEEELANYEQLISNRNMLSNQLQQRVELLRDLQQQNQETRRVRPRNNSPTNENEAAMRRDLPNRDLILNPI